MTGDPVALSMLVARAARMLAYADAGV